VLQLKHVPITTGGKTRLGGITKMGDRYLRKLLVVGRLRDAAPSPRP
jgi:transposase